MSAPAWADPNHLDWRMLGNRLRAWAITALAPPGTVTVRIGPPLPGPVPPPGVCNLETKRIELCAHHTLPGRPEPATVDLVDARGRARYATLAGVLAHEVGHARHSSVLPGSGDPRIDRWAELLEEPRVEIRVSGGRADVVLLLRAAATQIIGCREPTDAESAAAVLVLIGGRLLGGILRADALPDLDDFVSPHLTLEQVGVIGVQVARAIEADDGDYRTLYSAAAAIVAVLETDNADGAAADVAGGCVVGAQHSPGVLADAIAAVAMRAERELRAAAGIREVSPAEQTRRDARAARSNEISAAAAQAWQTPVDWVSRAPTAEESIQYRALLSRLRTAKTRAVDTTRVRSAAPPGRLVTAALMQRHAQIAAGATPTASPWTQTRRRSIEEPRLQVGIALDISASMQSFTDPTAVAGWALTRAVATLGGRACTVAWNDEAGILLSSDMPAQIRVPAIRGGSAGLPQALQALTAELGLDRARGARMVAVVTDSDLPNPTEVCAELAVLIEAGVSVLWLTTPWRIPGVARTNDAPMSPPAGVTARVINDPGQIGAVIGSAAVDALRV